MQRQFVSVVALLLTATTLLGAGAAEQPSPDYPAFHGGGALTGVAAPLPGGPELKPRWTYYTSDDKPAGIEGGAAVVGDTVYVGDMDGTLHAVDLKAGTAKWKYKAGGGFTTTPLVMTDPSRAGAVELSGDPLSGVVVLVGDDGGTFHAVLAKDGSALWTVQTNATIHASANAAGPDRVVFGNDAAEVHCVNLADGKELWKVTVGDRVNAAPAVANGAVLVSGCDAKLRGLSVADGKELFAFDMGALSGASPAVVGDRIYIGTDQGRVLCVSADGKTQHWLQEIADAPMVYASAAVADGVVVVGARNRKVHAYQAADGKPAWDLKTKGDVDSSPVISAGRVYVGSKDKRLYVLDLKTGEKLSEFQAGRGIIAPVAIGRGVVVVGDTAGALYCLEPK